MRFGIIGAMEQEIEWILSKMDNQKETIVANVKFYEGVLEQHPVLIMQSGIGKVNAALSTTILHERFKPGMVINTGSAGGTDSNLKVGDIVIGDEVIHHDVDATAFGYEYGQVPQMPEKYTSDGQLVEKAQLAVEKIDQNINVITGLIGSGDSFMSDEQRVKQVVSRFPKVKALEMEAAAIAQVCHQYGTPFVIIRSLSDIAGKDSDISFEQYLENAAKNSAQLIVNMLKV